MRPSRDPARPLPFYLLLVAALFTATPALLPAQPAPAQPPAAVSQQPATTPTAPASNPLLAEWTTPFGVPPFDAIRAEHFVPAFTAAMEAQQRQIAAIVENQEPPTFANTVEALDDSGELLNRVGSVFSNLRSAETSDQLQAIAKEIMPRLSAHEDDILLDPRLFTRIKAVWDARANLELGGEQKRLLNETHNDFVRAGALLDDEQKSRMREINEELARLGLAFGDNVLAATNAYRLVVEDEADLTGLPARVVSGGAAAARSAGLDGKWVFTLQAPSIWPFLESADNRELRRQILQAYVSRCNQGGDQDNTSLIAKIAALRAAKAKLLGYPTWADFVLEKNMAKNPAGVRGLLDQLWPRALAAAKRERAALQEMVEASGGDFQLAAWDWRYYAEKVKRAKYALDDAELRPYFPLDQVRDGAFWVAGQLYGLTFTPRADIPVYHPEVKAFEVKEADGRHLGVLFLDYHPRPGKRGGAWSSTYRKQWIKAGTNVTPVVVNVCNFSRPAGDAPALLSLDEVETLFHEFGHGLHQLLSNCRYRSLSGTSVPRDFVELGSQIMENWAIEPEVLKHYARHWQSGAQIPDTLIAKILKADTFNQGFATTEYLAASLLDMDWHTLNTTEPVDTVAFEAAALERMGLIEEIPPRYHSWYFNHIVGGYAAGYYSYVWAEVLDADAFQAFKEKGIFDRSTAASFRNNILSRGGTDDPMAMYVRFRGRAPSVEPLLVRRGLQ